MPIIKEIAQKIHSSSDKHCILLDFVLLLFLSAYILLGISSVPFHGDESAYIVISQDYDRIVKQRDFEHVLFKADGDSKQYTRLTTGSILAYSIGFARDITDNDDPIHRWLWGASWEDNILMGNMPASRLLNLARTCSALMGALAIALFFFLSYQLSSSRWVAWAATLTLATHGDILVNIRRALQEGPKFLFLILTIYIASYILKHFQSIKIRRYLYVFLGVASGLTLAAKQDTAPMLVAIYLALAFTPIWKRETIQNIFVNILYLGTATILAYAVFLLLMPVFWRWWENAVLLIGLAIVLFQLPVWKNNRSAKLLIALGFIVITIVSIRSPEQIGEFQKPISIMLETREIAVQGQLTHPSASMQTINDKTAFFLRTVFTSRVMYMEAASFDVPPFHEQIANYENTFFSGRINILFIDILLVIFVVIGGWRLIRYFNERSLFICILFVVTAVLLFMMIPLAWQRYFLIMQIPYSLIVGTGFHQILIWGKSYLTR